MSRRCFYKRYIFDEDYFNVLNFIIQLKEIDQNLNFLNKCSKINLKYF